MWPQEIEVAATVLAAGLITGATGFGFNLFATPVLALLMPVRHAVVISLLVGIVVTAAISALNARHVSATRLRPLAGGALAGIAAGAVIFHTVTAAALQIVVGVLGVAAVPAFLLGRRRALPINHRGAAPTVGLFSGVMTSISGMGGPPVVGYLLAADTPPSAMRATIAAYSTAAAAVSFAVLAATSGIATRP